MAMPAEKNSIPFWSWNCEVTEKLIDKQLAVFANMGFAGVCIHPRTGLSIPYLGERFLSLVTYAVNACAQKGLRCWLYDDDRFPSGAADGLVTQNWRTMGVFLLFTESYPQRADYRSVSDFLLPDYVADADTYAARADAGALPAGYFAAAYELEFSGTTLVSHTRLSGAEEIAQALSRAAASAHTAQPHTTRRVRFAYVAHLPKEPWFHGNSYIDTLSPVATDAFLAITHERYKTALGAAFGTSASAIFTDEPRMYPRLQGAYRIKSAGTHEDFAVPYSPYFAERFQKQYVMNALDAAPYFVWETTGSEGAQRRWQYYDALSESFVSNYMDRIADWCHKNGIVCTGHVLGEETLIAQTDFLGDCMRCYRRMDIPGIDVLIDDRSFLAAKQVVSVSTQYDKRGAVSELYGATHWNCDFKTYKLQGDWQAALGITVRVPHLAHMSLEGEAKRDWPASIFSQSPWYKDYRLIEQHFSRLAACLQHGRRDVSICVIHPVESCWLINGAEAETAAARREYDSAFTAFVNGLLAALLDFDLVAESLLPELCATAKNARPAAAATDEFPRFAVGAASYRVVVVPAMRTIRSTTLSALKAFRARGGTVVFYGEPPALVDALPSADCATFASQCACVPERLSALLPLVESVRDVAVYSAESGARASSLLYQIRTDASDGSRWLFICHAWRVKDGISHLERYTVRVRGTYTAIVFDTLRDEIYAVQVQHDTNTTSFDWHCYAEDSLLVKLEPTAGDAAIPAATAAKPAAGEQDCYTPLCRLETISAWDCSEPNVLLLDYARYALDGAPLSERMEILRLDNCIRSRLSLPPRQDNMQQPYAMERGREHDLVLQYEFESSCEVPVRLGIERPELYRIQLNGKAVPAAQKTTATDYYVDEAIRVVPLLPLKKGTNVLTLSCRFHQKMNLENLYLLGDFDVTIAGAHASVSARRKTLYLGSLTTQGLPFYTGAVTLEMPFTLSAAGRYSVHIPHLAATIVHVAVDGAEKGSIYLAPHRLQLGALEAGTHTLTLTVIGNRFNGFGTLHNAHSNYVWFGPDSYRTTGDNWSDSYLLKDFGITAPIELESVDSRA